MKIRDILAQGKPTLSLCFPPKEEDNFATVSRRQRRRQAETTSFMSVTYGAGGGSVNTPVDLPPLQNPYGVNALAHFDLRILHQEQVRKVLAQLQERNICNTLALRGDLPAEGHSTATIGMPPS